MVSQHTKKVIKKNKELFDEMKPWMRKIRDRRNQQIRNERKLFGLPCLTLNP